MGGQADTLQIPSLMRMTILAGLCYCAHVADDITEAQLINWDSSPVLMIFPWPHSFQLTVLSWKVELDGAILPKHEVRHTLHGGAYC